MPDKSTHGFFGNSNLNDTKKPLDDGQDVLENPGDGPILKSTRKNAVTPYGGGPAAKNLPMEMLGQERCAEFVHVKKAGTAWKEDPLTGCWLSTTSLRPDGYVSVKFFTNEQLKLIREKGSSVAAGLRRKEKNFMLHIVSYTAHHGRDVVGVASHLCGEKNCFNPLHINDESQSVNIARNYCQPAIKCSHGAELADRECDHEPACLRVRVVKCCYAADGIEPPPSHGQKKAQPLKELSGNSGLRPPKRRKKNHLAEDPGLGGFAE